MSGPITVMFTGDLILDEPDPDSFFDSARETLRSADLVVGHIEVPHTRRGAEGAFDVPAPPSDPAHLAALGRAGVHVATLAGNHMFDAGPEGIEDTVAALHAQGIASCGAGPTLDDARRPAIVERRGVRVGVLSYNCVGPRESWASSRKPGCAYVKVLTHYELTYATPGGPPDIYTFADPATLEAMERDVMRLRPDVHVLVVALHKGVAHTPALLAMYERQLSKAAIEAGADIVVGHHAHILRGIEVYKGRPVYHGLGNFVTVTRALSIGDNPSPERLAWAKRRQALFGFEPDPAYPTYPFHPEAKHTMLAVCEVDTTGIRQAGFVPCWVTPRGVPEVLGQDARGEAGADYVATISRAAGLEVDYRWNKGRVVVHEA